MAVLDTLVNELLGSKTVNTLSETAGADKDQVTKLVTAAVPVLIAGMQQNSKTKDGAQSLADALDYHADDDTSDVAKAVKNADETDGKKIVQHVLGDNNKDITKGLSKQTGLSGKQVTTILALLAPVLLSLLGSQKKEDNTSSGGLSSMLGSLLLGNSSSQSQSSGIDLGSIAGALLGGSSSSSSGSGLGGILGSLLGTGSSSGTGDVVGGLLGSLLGGGTSSSSSAKKDTTSDLAGDLLGSLLGGSSTTSSSKKKKDTDAGDVLGDVLGSLLK